METVKDHNNVSFSSMLGAKHVWSSFKKKMEEMGRKQTMSIVRSLKKFLRKVNEMNRAIAGGECGVKKIRFYIYSMTVQVYWRDNCSIKM